MWTLFSSVCATLVVLAAGALNCPAGFEDKELGDNRCYKFAADNRTWTMAYTECLTSAEGANLLSVPAPNDFYPLSFFVRRGGVDSWTGLLNLPGARSWADGSAYNDALDDLFAADPGAGLNGYLAAADGLFHLSDGSEQRGYVCFVDVTPPPTTTTTTEPTTTPSTRPPPACEDGWRQYADQCYLFSTEQQYWASAGHACHEQDAEPVSIHDSGALTFLLLSTNQVVFWIGLENQEDVYVWEDGSSAEDVGDILGPYMDQWSPGLDCLAINATAFPTVITHLNCLSQHNYICTKPARQGEEYYGPW